MRPNDWVVKETREWLVKAEADLFAADLCLSSGRRLPDIAAFHAQQAAEKSLKAFLTWHATPFRKTHMLIEVGEPCWKIDESLRPSIQRALPLSDFAWKHRYPGEPLDPTRDEAVEAVMAAQALFTAILARLPSDVHPY